MSEKTNIVDLAAARQRLREPGPAPDRSELGTVALLEPSPTGRGVFDEIRSSIRRFYPDVPSSNADKDSWQNVMLSHLGTLTAGVLSDPESDDDGHTFGELPFDVLVSPELQKRVREFATPRGRIVPDYALHTLVLAKILYEDHGYMMEPDRAPGQPPSQDMELVEDELTDAIITRMTDLGLQPPRLFAGRDGTKTKRLLPILDPLE